MKLSPKGRYASMALMHLALAENRGSIPLTELAEALGISLSYVEQLFTTLRANGLVKGTRGPGGGYRLTDRADEVTMAEIFKLFEPAPATNPSGPQPYLPQLLWDTFSATVYDFLSEIKLREFVEEHRHEVISSPKVIESAA